MAGIPKNFDVVSNVLANYNFVDIASGTGYINFYAGNTINKDVLSNFTYYSDKISYNVSANTGGNSVLVLDKDFDTLLNRPLDISGLGIVNIPVALSQIGAPIASHIIVILRKWDGANETDICTNTSRIANAALYDMLAVDLTIPLTHFKNGETLRLTINMYGTSPNGYPKTFSFGCDPMNRSATWDTSGAVPSKLIFQCPVRLNL